MDLIQQTLHDDLAQLVYDRLKRRADGAAGRRRGVALSSSGAAQVSCAVGRDLAGRWRRPLCSGPVAGAATKRAPGVGVNVFEGATEPPCEWATARTIARPRPNEPPTAPSRLGAPPALRTKRSNRVGASWVAAGAVVLDVSDTGAGGATSRGGSRCRAAVAQGVLDQVDRQPEELVVVASTIAGSASIESRDRRSGGRARRRPRAPPGPGRTVREATRPTSVRASSSRSATSRRIRREERSAERAASPSSPCSGRRAARGWRARWSAACAARARRRRRRRWRASIASVSPRASSSKRACPQCARQLCDLVVGLGLGQRRRGIVRARDLRGRRGQLRDRPSRGARSPPRRAARSTCRRDAEDQQQLDARDGRGASATGRAYSMHDSPMGVRRRTSARGSTR